MTFPEAAAYPETSQASTALVLGIVGIVCCLPLAIVAWIMANKELEGITSGRRNPQNEGTAKAARIVGIIGTVLFGIGLILLFTSLVGFIPFFDV